MQHIIRTVTKEVSKSTVVKSVAAVLGSLATAISLLELEPLHLALYISVAVLAIGAIFYMNGRTKHIPVLADPDYAPEYEVRYIETPAEFSQVDDLYQYCFKSSSIPTEVIKGWWRAYESGLIGLFKDNEIIGALSIWPLTVDVFEKLKNGYIQEREIERGQIDAITKNNWYVSEIALDRSTSNFQDKKNLASLIYFTIEHLAKEANNNFPVTVLALGYSPEGKRLLMRAGFKMQLSAKETKDKQDLFSLVVKSPSDLIAVQQKYQRILKEDSLDLSKTVIIAPNSVDTDKA
ncbi:GNAT family protein [Spirosoma fluminis]